MTHRIRRNLWKGSGRPKASVNPSAKQSIADAIATATAEQAKLILDELFERKNSLEINTVDINVEINKLMSKVRDVSKNLVRSMVFGNVDKTSW